MLDAIFQAINGIYEFFCNVVDFVTKIISDLVYVVQLIGDSVLQIPSYFSWLPASVVALLVTAFSIFVIYKILGRD